LCLETAAGTKQYEAFAVELVCPAFCHDVKCGPRRPAILGRECIRQNVYFLHCSQRYRRNRRLPAPTFVVARTVQREGRRATRADTSYEIDLVYKQVTCSLALTKRGIQKRQRRDLAAEDRRLIDLLAYQRLTDDRIGADPFRSSIDGHVAGRIHSAHRQHHL